MLTASGISELLSLAVSAHEMPVHTMRKHEPPTDPSLETHDFGTKSSTERHTIVDMHTVAEINTKPKKMDAAKKAMTDRSEALYISLRC